MLTEQQMAAASLVAGSRATVTAIAKKIGVTERTLYNWKNDPEFQGQVKTFADDWRSEVRRVGAADQDIRIQSLNDRLKRLNAVIQARAQDPDMKDVPGGRTGALTRTYKMEAGVDGEGNRIQTRVPEYAVDTGLLAEMRAIEQQIATELGQWKQPSLTTVNVTLLQRFENARRRLIEADEHQHPRETQ